MSDDKEPPGCECKYPHSCEKCWPSVTQAQLDAAIKPQSAGAAPREWQAWQIMDGVQLDTMRSDKLFIEHSAYLALERKFQETYESENRRIVELQAKLNHCAVTGAAVAVARDQYAANAFHLEKKHNALAAQLAEGVKLAAQWLESTASLEAERDRLRVALEQIAIFHDHFDESDPTTIARKALKEDK